MHASRRLTILAIGLWLAASAIGSLFTPLQVIRDARGGFSDLRQILAAADENAAAERIMLVGSSPVAVGISAKQIEQATGVASFNLAVSDSAEFFEDYLDEITRHVRKGDVVVLSDPKWLDRNRRTLPPGCIDKITRDCLFSRFSAFPHLSLAARFLLGVFHPETTRSRDLHGDLIAQDLMATDQAIEPMPPPAGIAAGDLDGMARLVERLNARGACPLLALGPVFVREQEQVSWARTLGALQDAADKVGLRRYLMSDGVAQTDRTNFFDSFEHPSTRGKDEWTRRIIDRLRDPSKGPCPAVMAQE